MKDTSKTFLCDNLKKENTCLLPYSFNKNFLNTACRHWARDTVVNDGLPVLVEFKVEWDKEALIMYFHK